VRGVLTAVRPSPPVPQELRDHREFGEHPAVVTLKGRDLRFGVDGEIPRLELLARAQVDLLRLEGSSDLLQQEMNADGAGTG
jgi:hypothetical protein